LQLSDINAAKAEIIQMLDSAKNQRVKKLLQDELVKITYEIEQRQKEQRVKETVPANAPPAKINVEIKEHAFDESEKYAKIFIPFNAAEIKDEDVELQMTEDSFSLIIHGASKNHHFTVTSLLKQINVAKSYKKVKTDMIAVYLKKAKEGETWTCLTRTEKHLKDQKSKMFDGEAKDEDPSSMLMNMMKKMYDSGDSDMKRTIAKAWTEGQNKQGQSPLGPM
jgi:calcyclin binding protein